MAINYCDEDRIKKPVYPRPNPFFLREKETVALIKSALADMKKHGFRTIDELIADYDSKRGHYTSMLSTALRTPLYAF